MSMYYYLAQTMMLARFKDHLITYFFECLSIIKCCVGLFVCLYSLYVDKILAKLSVRCWEIHKTILYSFWKKKINIWYERTKCHYGILGRNIIFQTELLVLFLIHITSETIYVIMALNGIYELNYFNNFIICLIKQVKILCYISIL